MSGYKFTPAENGDPELTGRYQAALAKLKPSCSRCGRTLTKRELESRRCAARDECRIRRSGGTGIAEYRALRKFIAEHGSPFIVHARTIAPEPVEVDRWEDDGGPPMLDPSWTPQAGYAHAERLMHAEPQAPIDEWRPSNPYVWRPRAT